MTSVFAHRGYRDTDQDRGGKPDGEGLVENTLAAFAEAARRGADGVKLDVRRTADGALVVLHDAVLDDGRVLFETPLGQLPQHIPLLADALAACEGMTVNVEVKNSPRDPGYEPDQAIATDAAQVVVDAGWADRVIVSSFEPEVLDAVRATGTGLPLGWLLGVVVDPSRPGPGPGPGPGAGPGADHQTAFELAAERGYQALHPFVAWVDGPLVDRAHAMGLALNTWTVNARSDLEAMVAAGVDAVITDRLDEALLVAHGAGPRS